MTQQEIINAVIEAIESHYEEFKHPHIVIQTPLSANYGNMVHMALAYKYKSTKAVIINGMCVFGIVHY